MLIKLPKKITELVNILEDKQAREIMVLKLGKLAGFTNYFVICTGESLPQVKAIAGELVARLPRRKPYGRQGFPQSSWVLLDYGDVIVHIFLPEARRYYELEKVWADAPAEKIGW